MLSALDRAGFQGPLINHQQRTLHLICSVHEEDRRDGGKLGGGGNRDGGEIKSVIQYAACLSIKRITLESSCSPGEPARDLLKVMPLEEETL